MKNYTLTISLLIIFSFFSHLEAQRPDLGSLAHFVLFTSDGAVGSTGVSDVTGDIGTNAGAITGFVDISGNMYNADATTAQAAIDVTSAYNQLLGTPATYTSHTPVFGNGETLFAGVYSITGAVSVLGSLTLDAQGDPNAIFIFKAGGALTTGALTTIYLINSASAHNIFWIANGAVSMAASTTISGTFIANNGAVDMGDGSFLDGRLLSTAGAVSVYGTQAVIPVNTVLSMNGLSITGRCEAVGTRLTWPVIKPDINDITIQGSADGLHWISLKKINREEKAWFHRTFLFADQSIPSLSFYRLEGENPIGAKEYGAVIRILPCTIKSINRLSIYPNPSTGIFRMIFIGKVNEVRHISIFNLMGMEVYSSKGISNYINVSHLPSGVYIVKLQSGLSQLYNTLQKL